jgi:hypothetical protein
MMKRRLKICKICKNYKIKYHTMKANLKTDGLIKKLTKTAKSFYKMIQKCDYKLVVLSKFHINYHLSPHF